MNIKTNVELQIELVNINPEIMEIKASLLKVSDNLFFGIITFFLVNHNVTYSGHFFHDTFLNPYGIILKYNHQFTLFG
jgi:hypothetical protein